MATTYLTHGIVLKRRDYREVDRVLTLYTKEYGKIEALARGVKKIVSKLAGHLEPLSYSSFMFARGRTFDIVATSIRLSSFRIPLSDVQAFALASYFFEAVDRLTPYEQSDPKLFALLVQFLEVFENGVDQYSGSPAFQRLLIMEFFLLQLLMRLGYAPSLEQCTVCRDPITGDAALSYRHGGLVCAKHRGEEPDAEPLSRQAIELLRLMADGDLEPVRLLNRQDDAFRAVATAINRFLKYHLGQPLQSETFLTSVFTP